MISLSKLAASIVQSEIRIMSVECAKLGGINLAQGVCDTELPPPVRDGAIQAIGAGMDSYTRLDGIAGLRRAIAASLRRDIGMTVDAEREVVVAVGATGECYCTWAALLARGGGGVVVVPGCGC